MKTPPKKKENKAKAVSAVLWLAFLVIIMLVNSGALSHIRLPSWIYYPNMAAVAAVFGVLILLVGAVAIAVAVKKKSADRMDHCHDRLHPEHTEACPDRMTHWKKQLDGFLEAGIIEKEEYRFLLDKYSRQTSDDR